MAAKLLCQGPQTLTLSKVACLEHPHDSAATESQSISTAIHSAVGLVWCLAGQKDTGSGEATLRSQLTTAASTAAPAAAAPVASSATRIGSHAVPLQRARRLVQEWFTCCDVQAGAQPTTTRQRLYNTNTTRTAEIARSVLARSEAHIHSSKINQKA